MTRAEGRPDLHIALRAVGCDGERPSAKHDIFSIEKGDGRVASAHHQIGKLADVTLTPGMIEGERASIFVEMAHGARSEEHTSELQSLMRISYAVFCLKKKKTKRQASRTQTLFRYKKGM